MAKVAELSVDIDADDRATAKIMAVDALIKGLGGDVVTTVDADVAGATAELERFKQTADALDEAASLIASVGNVEHQAELHAKYDALRAELQ